jgi:CBS domain-containing protein
VHPDVVYVSRIAKRALIDAEGATIGKIDDVVGTPPSRDDPPRVIGFVATVQRRHIFVNAGRVGEVEPLGVRLRSGTIDLRHFQQRHGELLLIGDVFGKRMGDHFVTDVAIRRASTEPQGWWIASVALGGRGPLRGRRNPRIVDWSEAAALFDAGPEAAEVAELHDMHPADVAAHLGELPLARRRQLAALMEDDRLADLLEELPVEEQVRIMESLDIDRAAAVLEEMEPDDAVDLLAEMDEEGRSRLLAAMEPDEATPLRRLLTYGENTAGGLMTTEPLALQPTSTVAEALALIRERRHATALAAQVFVVQPPTSTPTGRFLGAVGFQRLLREAPGTALGDCVDDEPEFIPPDLPDIEVANRLAVYDLVAIAVCDAGTRLVGAVTVDDVMDRMLPAGWRHHVKGG